MKIKPKTKTKAERDRDYRALEKRIAQKNRRTGYTELERRIAEENRLFEAQKEAISDRTSPVNKSKVNPSIPARQNPRPESLLKLEKFRENDAQNPFYSATTTQDVSRPETRGVSIGAVRPRNDKSWWKWFLEPSQGRDSFWLCGGALVILGIFWAITGNTPVLIAALVSGTLGVLALVWFWISSNLGKADKLVLMIFIGVMILGALLGFFASQVNLTNTDKPALPAESTSGKAGSDLTYDAYYQAKEFVKKHYPGAKSFSDFDHSKVINKGDGHYAISLTVTGVNSFNAPIQDAMLVEMRGQSGIWYLEQISSLNEMNFDAANPN